MPLIHDQFIPKSRATSARNETCPGYFDRVHFRARVLRLIYSRTYGRNACKHAEVARRMAGDKVRKFTPAIS